MLSCVALRCTPQDMTRVRHLCCTKSHAHTCQASSNVCCAAACHAAAVGKQLQARVAGRGKL